MSVRSCFKSYVKTLEYIENTKCKIEELSQDEYREVSRGICWGDIQVIDGYLFLTPLGMDIIWEFYQRKKEIEENKEKSSEMNSEFRESLSMGEGMFVGFIFMMFIIGLVLVITKSCAN